jgi:hypothetical protein
LIQRDAHESVCQKKEEREYLTVGTVGCL